VRIVDIKCPSSGEAERNAWENIDLLRPSDEVKFVIGTRADYEWACEVLREHDLAARCAVLFAPVAAERGLEPVRLAEWILADRLDVRLGLQLHKIIWSATTRGV